MRLFIKQFALSLMYLSLFANAIAQEPEKNSNEPLPPGLYADGASMTTGNYPSGGYQQGEPIRWYIEKHFTDHDLNLEEMVGKHRIFLGMDYFFPTSHYFPDIDQGGEWLSIAKAFKADVQKKLAALQSQYDYVLLGANFLPSELNGKTQKRIQDHPERFELIEEYEQMLGWFGGIGILGLSSLNAALYEFADEQEDEEGDPTWFILSTNGYVEELVSRVSETGTDTLTDVRAMRDALHFSPKGVAIYFNKILLPALKQIPGFKEATIPPMLEENPPKDDDR